MYPHVRHILHPFFMKLRRGSNVLFLVFICRLIPDFFLSDEEYAYHVDEANVHSASDRIAIDDGFIQ